MMTPKASEVHSDLTHLDHRPIGTCSFHSRRIIQTSLPSPHILPRCNRPDTIQPCCPPSSPIPHKIHHTGADSDSNSSLTDLQQQRPEAWPPYGHGASLKKKARQRERRTGLGIVWVEMQQQNNPRQGRICNKHFCVYFPSRTRVTFSAASKKDS
jgi:hypothetical protein